jgi:hypothetical protein
MVGCPVQEAGNVVATAFVEPAVDQFLRQLGEGHIAAVEP